MWCQYWENLVYTKRDSDMGLENQGLQEKSEGWAQGDGSVAGRENSQAQTGTDRLPGHVDNCFGMIFGILRFCEKLMTGS